MTKTKSLVSGMRVSVAFIVASALDSGKRINIKSFAKENSVTPASVRQVLQKLLKAKKITRTWVEPKNGKGRGEFVYSR